MDNNSLIPVYTAFGGILLGAVASFFPAYFLERARLRNEAVALTEGIVTEIRVTLALLKMRRYVEDVGRIAASIQTGEVPASTFEVMVPEDFSPIYKANRARVGLLPTSIRNDVVEFHQLIEAAIADIRPGGLMAVRQCGHREFSDLLAIMTAAVRLGGKILETPMR